MTDIKQPSVAGQFYPENPKELQSMVLQFLHDAPVKAPEKPKAIIAPHAGYIYSGLTAGFAYNAIKPFADQYKKVLLFAPAHRFYVDGIAFHSADQFATPLGNIAVDIAARDKLKQLSYCQQSDVAFDLEHALEVHFPFLQKILTDFTVLPLLVGGASPDMVHQVIDLLDDDLTLIVISSDLSHYHPYIDAQQLDQAAADAIVNLAPEQMTDAQACGRIGIKGLLQYAKARDLKASCLDLRNSGDTAGPKDKVVGYGAFRFV